MSKFLALFSLSLAVSLSLRYTDLDGILVLEYGVDGESPGPPLYDLLDGEGLDALLSTLQRSVVSTPPVASCISGQYILHHQNLSAIEEG